MFFIYYLSLLYSLILVKKITGGILIPKLFNIIYLFFLLFIFIGGYSIYINESFTNDEAALLATISIILTMYFLPLGYLLSSIVMKKSSSVNSSLIQIDNKDTINKKGLYISILVILSSCFLYYTSLTNIPLLSVFDSTVQSKYVLAESRSDATNNLNFSNKNYIFKLLVGYRDFIQITLLSFIVGYLYLKYKHNKNTVNLILFIFPFLLLIFNSVSTLKKADIIFTILFLFFINSYDNYKKNIKSRLDKNYILKLFSVGLVGFSLLIVVYSLFMKIPFSNIGIIISSIFERVFISSVKPLYYYFSIFPDYHEFLMGKSISPTIMAGMFNPETFNVENYIHRYIYPEVYERGIVGTAPTIFTGEVYANFGFIIMTMSILLVGFIIGFIERNLENFKYTYLNVAFYIMLAFTIKDISISSIQSVIGFPTIISKVLIFLLFFYLILFKKEPKYIKDTYQLNIKSYDT